jgi:hypothetical protein
MYPMSTTDHSQLLRKCFVALATFAILGTIAELAAERHWQDSVQLIPWASIGVLVIAIMVFLIRPTVAGIRVARAMTIPVALSVALGIYYHVNENHKAGFLDYRYATTWETMSSVSQWWKALSKTVGPAPTLAPAALLIACLCLFFATLRHPAFAARARSTAARGRQPVVDLSDGLASVSPSSASRTLVPTRRETPLGEP